MNIESWICRRFHHVTTYGSGRDLMVDCPFCEQRVGKTEPSHHLCISLVKNTCHCFRCEYSASWVRLIMDVDGVSYQNAKKACEDRLVPLYKLRRQEQTVSVIDSMPDEFITVSDALGMDGMAGRSAMLAFDYMEARLEHKVKDWKPLLDLWGVFASAYGYGKLVLPVERGWYQCRQIRNGHTGPKYLSPSDSKGDRLYNYMALELYGTVKITEGIISAVCAGRDAVALCGKTATPEQMQRFCASCVETFVICLDADAHGEMIMLANALGRHGKRVVLRTYATGDPASSHDYSEEEYGFQECVKIMLGV